METDTLDFPLIFIQSESLHSKEQHNNCVVTVWNFFWNTAIFSSLPDAHDPSDEVETQTGMDEGILVPLLGPEYSSLAQQCLEIFE